MERGGWAVGDVPWLVAEALPALAEFAAFAPAQPYGVARRGAEKYSEACVRDVLLPLCAAFGLVRREDDDGGNTGISDH